MATVTRRSPEYAVLRGVRYDVYVALRDAPANGGLRMTYHDGTLEIMSPEFRHEHSTALLGAIVRAYTAVLGVRFVSARSTTFRRGRAGRKKGFGKEPDESFYFAHADAVRNRASIDLDAAPPPDLWIEVDNRVSSAGRLPVYAALRVPEVWVYRPRKGTLGFLSLDGDAYRPIDRSLSLNALTPAIVLDLLAEADRQSENEWDVWMRDWMRANLTHTQERP
jgi:Uma2 family endonuclease